MMPARHVVADLSAYCHGSLKGEAERRVAEHLLACRSCRAAFEEIRSGVEMARQIPAASAPSDLWDAIEARLGAGAGGRSIDSPAISKPGVSMEIRIKAGASVRRLALAAAVVMAASLPFIWYLSNPAPRTWAVASLAGSPMIGDAAVGSTGRLTVGEWIETDSSSRALIEVADIGHVEVEPNSRLRLLATRRSEHRLSLEHGAMNAVITAPPRLFFVETPSATAADLGCAYRLVVDDAGSGHLEVTLGWVALENGGRESIVPAGARCEMRRGFGPGTPYENDATPVLREALDQIDFARLPAPGRGAALATILSEARSDDALTLWHLLVRVDTEERGPVFDRLSALVKTPEGVTREGVVRGEKKMLDAWRDDLGLRGGAGRSWKFPWEKNRVS